VIVGVNAENKIYMGTFDKTGKFNDDWHQIIPGASPVGAGLSGVSIDTLRSLSCTNGQVAKWNGSIWACSDVGTSPHTHAGSDITSGIVSASWIDSAIARDSEVSSLIGTHTANASAHHTRYTNAEAVAAIKAADGSGSGLDADLLDGQHASAFASAGQVYTKAEVDSLLSALQSRITALENKLAGLTRSGNDFVITNANLYIQSGSGATDGTVNGKGNLIIGYNESRGSGNDVRTGSHNLIVGSRHNYSKYGGIVVGHWNTISGQYSSVSGGRNNTASGNYSFVAGGGSENSLYGNKAFGDYTAILGGDVNIAGDPGLTDHTIGMYSTVCGGGGNIASGIESSIGGGLNNTASGKRSMVSGGRNNIASGDCSSVVGGGSSDPTAGNKAFAHYSAILGGIGNQAGDSALVDHSIGQGSTVSGGNWNAASGEASSISGGDSNKALGNYSSVSGGGGNQAQGVSSSISGGWYNITSGKASSVSGGTENTASGFYSSVSGGYKGTANGTSSSVSGGNSNFAGSTGSSVSGGYANDATGVHSSVSGGTYNTASGTESSVSGGYIRTADNTWDWAAGGLYQGD